MKMVDCFSYTPPPLKLAIDAFEAAPIVAGGRYEQTRAHRFTAAPESLPAASRGAEVGFQHSITTYQAYFAPASSQR